jgi:cytochrome c peroxidase
MQSAVFIITVLFLFAGTTPAYAWKPTRSVNTTWQLKKERYNLEKKLRQQVLNHEQIELGNKLFFDKKMSGNEDISCATCHHPFTFGGDNLALPLGQSAKGLSVTRTPGDMATGVMERVPRNAPSLWNMGLFSVDEKFFNVAFWDGRLFVDDEHPTGFTTPAGDNFLFGINDMLSAQACFPVTSFAEMAGEPGDNAVAAASDAGMLNGEGGVWDLLAKRIRNIPEYVEHFKAAYPSVNVKEDITYVHIANALGAFEAEAFKAVNSPFDRYLMGDYSAMSFSAKRGMRLFYGKAGCSSCHSGIMQTDQKFHSVAAPQIGPGKGNGFMGHDDFGREIFSGEEEDRYTFRTPSLRQVALTAPYMHAGAYDDLREAVLHHLNPKAFLAGYDISKTVLPSRPDLDALDVIILNDAPSMQAIAESSDIGMIALYDRHVDDILAFLHSLTDPGKIDLRNLVPASVPSGLPLAD